MIIAKQMDVRSNIKKYFDMAFEGEPVVVPRKQDRNVVIISESEYNRLQQSIRVSSYYNEISMITGNKRSPAISTPGNVRKHNLDKLNVIRSLKDNWNGNGAPAFSRTLTDKAEQLINELDIQPEIFPTALNTIQLEYDNSRRDHMEIEIGEGDNAEIFIVNFNGSELIEEIPVTAFDINERVHEFYG